MSANFSAWIGRTEHRTDVLEPSRTNALSAALGRADSLAFGQPLPPLHHWLYFWDVRPPEQLGSDGHPARGGFLPPVPLPRRMWAGGRVQFERPLLVGETVTRISTIAAIEAKRGRSGDLVFVTVRHEISDSRGRCIIEEQDLVYREADSGPTPPPANAKPTSEAPWSYNVMPDAVLLFRYSALTMNGHRIHYDRSYATGEEGYPGLVVHGPLQATLMAELAERNLAGPLKAFDYRGQAPAFDGTILSVCGQSNGDGARVWTEQGGVINMVGSATC